MTENLRTRIPGAAVNDRHYTLVCLSCGMRQYDDGLVLACPGDHEPALLRTEYTDPHFSPRLDRDGLSRYRSWLPVIRAGDDVGRAIVYRSRRLASALGLANLWIAFSGYWPERGANLETATFKEFEAHTVIGRLPDRQVILTIPSSGNTGAAFAWACSRGGWPCLLIVPGKSLHRLKFRQPLQSCVKLVAIEDGDYPDAIALASSLSQIPPFHPEGGVRNVGRRDGLATVLLSAYELIDHLPSHYFQAVGSGTGAIAVLEAALRMNEAPGTPGPTPLPKLMLCQNLPFTPIHDAWRTRRRPTTTPPQQNLRTAIGQVLADELTNAAPPYEIRGGLYDSLVLSQGDVLVTDNAAARAAMSMFEELEGVDIEPAAGVALACLRDAAAQAKVGKDSLVLLNVTGGGRRRLSREHALMPAEPQLRLARSVIGRPDVVQKVAEMAASMS